MRLRFVKVTAALVGLVFLPLYVLYSLNAPISVDAAHYPTLAIPAIALDTPVAPVELKDHKLETPATIAGSYSHSHNKTLLIGHSSTVFRDLSAVQLGDLLTYNGQTYRVTDITTQLKSDINMYEVLAPADVATLILMTCAGDALPGQDATHRLLITAEIVPRLPEIW